MGDSAYNVLGLPDLELVSQHYETRKHQDGYSYDIIVYAVKHVGYVPYCHACQEATGEEFQSMEHFKQELIEYLDYYNNRRIKAKLKGLPPAIHRQQALSAV